MLLSYEPPPLPPGGRVQGKGRFLTVWGWLTKKFTYIETRFTASGIERVLKLAVALRIEVECKGIRLFKTDSETHAKGLGAVSSRPNREPDETSEKESSR